jgi:hypothetical protein
MTWLLLLTLVSPSGSRIQRWHSSDYHVLVACQDDGVDAVRKQKMPATLLAQGWKIEYTCVIQGTNGKDERT